MPTSAWRHAVISSMPTLGTLRLTTSGGSGSSLPMASATRAATSAAVSQRWSWIISSQPWPSTPKPTTDWLTAMPLYPPLRAVSAAPTVPEW